MTTKTDKIILVENQFILRSKSERKNETDKGMLNS